MAKSTSQFEVLSPWAEVDPLSPKGITPRVKDLAGKKIGMFVNPKRAGRPILETTERKLRERYPTAEFIYYEPGDHQISVEEMPKFEEWVKGVDAVIAAVGD
ncbi:hypothetical protein ACFLU1_06985 [Chloroflexota bacterium]